MTVRDKLEDMLVGHGLWPDEAKTVTDKVVTEPAAEVMRTRWTEPAGGYPPQLFNVIFMTARRCAIEYLKANKPKHFALLVLEPQSELAG